MFEGGKFNLSKASSNANHGQIKEALSLLEKAGLIYSVTHSAGNGLPISMENFNRFQDISVIPFYAAGYFLKTS